MEVTISKKVLFVDDEPRLLEAMQRQLRKFCNIYTAESAAEGLDVLSQHGPFALVISDFSMPDVDGITFLNQVHEKCPETVLAMLTGRAELDVAVNALHKGHISRFLNKPCPKELLLQTIMDCLEQYRLVMNERLLQVKLADSNRQLNVLNQRLEERVNERTETLLMQYEYVRSLTQMQTCQQICEMLLKTVTQMAKFSQIALFINFDDGEDTFVPHCLVENDLAIVHADQVRDGIVARVINQRETVTVAHGGNISASDKLFFLSYPIACTPLRAEKKIIGLLTIGGEPKDAIDETLLSSVKTVVNATVATLLSHWHLEARNEAQDAIITALAKLSEYRDNETGTHLLRLKKYCALICQLLGQTKKYKYIITQQFSDDLVRSSPMHDIGKVGIPDAILKKPGKLSDDEFNIMKTHATIGGDTLRSVFDRYKSQTFIKSGMEVAYCHHEKWDGSGYPNGMKGQQIPLTARILMLADVYDALTTKRVYKPAFSREKARAMIAEGSGCHFDPDIVDVFLNNEPLFYEIVQTMADEIIPS